MKLNRYLSGTAVMLAAWCSIAGAQTGGKWQDRESFVRWMNATHKAPYERMAAGAAGQQTRAVPVEEAGRARRTEGGGDAEERHHNRRVKQDLNPYAKAVGGVAVDPRDGRDMLVVTNDDRLGFGPNVPGEPFTHDFFHVSRDRGKRWWDGIYPYLPVTVCCVGGGTDSYDANAVMQASKGVSFDGAGHSYEVEEVANDYSNGGSSVGISISTAGYYNPVVVDTRVFGYYGPNDETLETQGGATDVSGTATDGSTYVYYTVFCDLPSGFTCGEDSVAGGSSVMKVASSPAFDQLFGSPAIWSGGLQNAGEGSMVIDSQGTPHLFFLDYTNKPKIDLWESTNGVVGAAPVAEFVDAGLNNPGWQFSERKVLDCGGHAGMAYCAFTATQVGGGAAESTPSVYLAAVDLATGKTSVSRVNDDRLGNGKDHFDPSVAVTPAGDVYVGWFDNRRDAAGEKVDYFVGKSGDEGKTFRKQDEVNDVAFDPTIGGIGPSGAVASGLRGLVHAVWSDTRDGATMQVWTDAVEW